MPPDKSSRQDELERACRALRQADIAGLLRDSQDRRAALLAERWSQVAQYIDPPRGEESQ